MKKLLLQIVSPTLFILLWTLVSWRVESSFVPSPIEVKDAARVWIFGSPKSANVMQGGVFDGNWHDNLLNSTIRATVGFLIAVLLGIPIGLIIGWNKTAALVLDPLIQLLRPIPITAWLPFAIVLFGIRENSAYFLIALGCFFPVVVNSADGARQTPKVLVRAARSLGSNQFSVFRKVVFPNSLPFIFTGLRIAIGLAWVLVIVAELLAVQSGIGFSMWTAYQQFRTDVIVCCMITVGLMGFMSDKLVVIIRNKRIGWAVSE